MVRREGGSAGGGGRGRVAVTFPPGSTIEWSFGNSRISLITHKVRRELL